MKWISIKGSLRNKQVTLYNGKAFFFDTLWYGLKQCFIDTIFCLLDRKAAKDHEYEPSFLAFSNVLHKCPYLAFSNVLHKCPCL